MKWFKWFCVLLSLQVTMLAAMATPVVKQPEQNHYILKASHPSTPVDLINAAEMLSTESGEEDDVTEAEFHLLPSFIHCAPNAHALLLNTHSKPDENHIPNVRMQVQLCCWRI